MIKSMEENYISAMDKLTEEEKRAVYFNTFQWIILGIGNFFKGLILGIGIGIVITYLIGLLIKG